MGILLLDFSRLSYLCLRRQATSYPPREIHPLGFSTASMHDPSRVECVESDRTTE